MEEKKDSKNYTAQSIKVLEGLEGVRKRPAMYIGSTGVNGLHHLVYEVVDNSVDEALAGFCNNIEIVLHQDGSCSVKDDGRGIPVDIHETEGISAAEVVLTKLHAGGKFSKDSYKFSGGLHGVGVSVVNALSKKLELVICRDGHKYQQFYSQGHPQGPLTEIGSSDERGTYVRFSPDGEIFSTLEFNFDILAARIRELAFLNKGLKISIQSQITNQSEDFFFEGGISSFIEHINKKKNPLFPEVISFNRFDDQYVLDFACQYNDSYQEQSFSFVNNIRTGEGGTHEAGFRSALTKVCNKYGQQFGMVKDEAFSSDDVREGLVSVLSIKVPEPQFEGQTKNKLGNAEVKGIVDSWVYSFLDVFFEENPSITKMILQKAVLAQQARLAAKKARDLSRKKNIFEHCVLPGKMADCSESIPEKTEMYIVEGESAGGSAKQARNRMFQAILPIRGKILNVEKTSIARALSNNEIKDLITAVGAGIGEDEFDVSKARYHKIIIMTDADVDGSHIRILLLTFFFRYMRPLIDKGYVYIAQPPLYKAKIGKHEKYLKNDSELSEFIFDWAKKNISISVENEVFTGDRLEQFLDLVQNYQKELQQLSRHIEIPSRYLHDYISYLAENNANKSLEWLATKFESTKNLVVNMIVSDEDPSKKHLQFFDKTNHVKFSIFEDIFASADVELIFQMFEGLKKFNQNLTITVGQRSRTEIAKDVYGLAQKIMFLGKSILTLQRYKGLGEMNPDQLWETTMDPEVRTLLQVTIDDAIKADQIFENLMGDDVEPRRKYIEEHAQFVRNLDVYNKQDGPF